MFLEVQQKFVSNTETDQINAEIKRLKEEYSMSKKELNEKEDAIKLLYLKKNEIETKLIKQLQESFYSYLKENYLNKWFFYESDSKIQYVKITKIFALKDHSIKVHQEIINIGESTNVYRNHFFVYLPIHNNYEIPLEHLKEVKELPSQITTLYTLLKTINVKFFRKDDD